ncbi:hypothetical protein JK386_13075 [Nocardioides sp. zg-536]|uniref:YrhK domain-containing protein n=1 Tax=Nocardioides faecalis TaxID=2803858 RepID=A0A938YB88_9ACTN|nr:hypothetical protein [Nocardioides faecalis]MBM9460836.1 hypothetical protein [Nocardioides faecalis]MBS4752774.1 hypothetical protein [Nocardioides faecalis]QVI58024.1 hypothetical protein KG111_13450 [Nocardioides faecalis]
MAQQLGAPRDAPRAHPASWDLHQVERTGPFATRVTWRAANGTMAQWDSRSARRRGRIQLLDAAGRVAGFVETEPAVARRMARANLVATSATTVGAVLFALGALLAQLQVGTTPDVDTVYVAGGVLFSLGGYVALLQASNAPTDLGADGALTARGWRWFAFEPQRIGWLSAAVLFGGTIIFGVSLLASYASDLTPRQTDSWVWGPDILGCVCFLVSGHLALVEVGHGWIWRIVNDLGWWIASVNQVGSIIFFLAGLASFVQPATSTAVNAGLANWGTFAGSLFFVVGGVLQLFERPSRPGARGRAGR